MVGLGCFQPLLDEVNVALGCLDAALRNRAEVPVGQRHGRTANCAMME
jgi:hypothetical protein